MDYELGGWLWLVMDVLAVALLGAASAYALMSDRRHFRDETLEMRRYLLDEERHAVLAKARAPRR